MISPEIMGSPALSSHNPITRCRASPHYRYAGTTTDGAPTELLDTKRLTLISGCVIEAGLRMRRSSWVASELGGVDAWPVIVLHVLLEKRDGLVVLPVALPIASSVTTGQPVDRDRSCKCAGKVNVMGDGRHRSSCGRRLARKIMATGGFEGDAAFAVHRHCGVSLLRAHRIARGYTLVGVVEMVKEILRSRGVPSEGLAHQQLSRWENGRDTPSPRYLDALCALYGTRCDRLGFGNDYSDAWAIPLGGEETVDRRMPSNPAVIGAEFTPLSMIELLSSNGGVPDRGSTAVAYVDQLEARTERAGYVLYAAVPTEFVPTRMADLAQIKAALMSVQSAEIRRRLYRLVAKNAGFIGIRIMDVAGLDDALEWLGLARRASRLAEDPGVEAWIAGHICTSCAWYGRFLDFGLAAAHLAQSAGGSRPNAAAVFGYLAEAGIQARMACRRETMAAIREADRMFAVLPEAEAVADGCHIIEYFLRWHQSAALTALGATTDAGVLRTRALELPFSRQDPVGALALRLDDAASKAAEGELDWACRVIADVWDRTPSEYRIGQIPRRALQILDNIAPANAASSQVRAVRDLLVSPRPSS
ncbi:helix-turn-helix domain-containing protein [Nocardia sp. NPDC051052]|uniref:helix-turn-helix domain-containing protein n=1 Tax=Nocardia sp. NPDC051052 TaxID=3364322 RepID=UPI0037ABA22B